MRFFGLEITKARPVTSGLSGGWWGLVREPFGGAWQRGRGMPLDSVVAHHAVYSCVTLIANDVGKLRPKLVEQDDDGIWSEVMGQSPFAPVLRRPNRFQNRIQFLEWWITSKLLRGNTYVLKERDARGIVRALYCLDPARVTPLVTTEGDVYYQLGEDNLSGLTAVERVVPASEIIHDRMNCLFHPLVGLSPIFASGTAADIGLKIEQNSADFFANGSNPSGILTAPGTIPQETAERIRAHWESEYAGANSGKVAVLGNDLKYQPMRMSAVDSQMIEHLKWTAETVCSAFHVPSFKLGIGQMPTYQNGELLNGIYYSDCLQSLIEQLELCLDEGLGLTDSPTRTLGVELDIDALLRMDTATQIKALGDGVGAGIVAPNEARKKLDLPPVVGGETPYLQQQNYALSALAARDAMGPPTNGTPPTPPDDPMPEPEPEPKAFSPDFLRAFRAELTRCAA